MYIRCFRCRISSRYISFSSGTQLSQTAHFSLQTPYQTFGLGETPNIIDEFSVGIPHPQNTVSFDDGFMLQCELCTLKCLHHHSASVSGCFNIILYGFKHHVVQLGTATGVHLVAQQTADLQVM